MGFVIGAVVGSKIGWLRRLFTPRSQMLDEVAAQHPELTVWRVEVPDFDAPVAKAHLDGVSGLPVVWTWLPGSRLSSTV